VNDIRDKVQKDWSLYLFTKDEDALKTIFREEKIQSENIHLFSEEEYVLFPFAFQNPELEICFITDREISFLKEQKKKITGQKVFLDFMSGLKVGDYVVHTDHGIARFLGLEQRTIDDITREYLKLGYAENDKLFVPIEQADKVNKYITNEDSPPHLTRLGSAEWETVTSRVKKETEKIAQELLKLYAERKVAKGFGFKSDNEAQKSFEEGFPYEETPGQLKAILDVKKDMERQFPMDRLVCGDVGFGKTEVALRAAFKAVQGGKQVALISPITILADQHYRVFHRRMSGFGVRVEMLSRFRSAKEQKEILKKLEHGEIDVLVGTHRLLQPDIKFKDLGLVVIDEEQRFGVKQKEKLKELRMEVDILTMTATPIPRTLNVCLNKLRDISTITTPPPGRLPIITEVRKFSMNLIRETILRELQRGGQVYFLHNRVQTIDSMAEKLKSLIPEARFGVTHGKLGSHELEERILAFKDHKFDVLVSSAIIENGIDLPNANTLIVNNAERFGLAQLYQLRGRVGRGRTQAYAYFLYHGQRLKLDAKRRLKAIVEASDLGSGFQIAMKDLEIRGAGEVLGVRQHGAINVVGVGHFIRMLNKAVEDLQAGRSAETEETVEQVSVELPLTCYVPDYYIVSSKDKITLYQRMASADTFEYLEELKDDVIAEYGKMPKEVMNLFLVLELKLHARKAGIVTVKAENVQMAKEKQEISLLMSKAVKPQNIMNLLEYNAKWQISGNKLRAKISDLGINWVDTLRGSLVALGKEVK
jgi:transcription-repair coupling factor (superfamily II helicase)